MFPHQKKANNLLLWVFGIIALAIIVATAILLLKIVDKGHEVMQSGSSTLTLPVITHEEMVAQYDSDLNTIQTRILQRDETMDTLLSQVEDRLLQMRVPEEYKDAHLKRVLGIVALRAQLNEEGEDSIYKDLSSLVNN